MPRPLDTLRAACRRNGLALSTERTYAYWTQCLVRFHRDRTGAFEHPARLAEADVLAFLDRPDVLTRLGLA